MYFKFEKQQLITNMYTQFKSNPSSPFAQSWAMFAPKPTERNGFITFERKNAFNKFDNLSPQNPFNKESNFKPYPIHHPFRALLELTVSKLGTSSFKDINQWQLKQICNYYQSIAPDSNDIQIVYYEFSKNEKYSKENTIRYELSINKY